MPMASREVTAPRAVVRALAAALLGAAAAGTPVHAAAIERLAWLQGCWALSGTDRTVDEQWMSPRAGTMLGMSRTVRGERVTSYEWVRLRELAGRFEYEVHPSGQAVTVFTSTALGQTDVLFENPQNDFPRRIGYERKGTKLLAWIDGPLKGETRRIEFGYDRVPCAAD